MISAPEVVAALPRALSSYPDQSGLSIVELLIERVRIEPFNAIATAIFALAIAHTFATVRFSRHASKVQQAHDERMWAAGKSPTPSVSAELLHFLGEIEAVFGLWAVVLVAAMVAYAGWENATHYFNDVTYTEPLFVVVIMALASTRPIITFAERSLRQIANF